MRKTRLGILDAVPLEYYLPGERSDPEKFEALFNHVRAPIECKAFHSAEGHFPTGIHSCDAYLITGSPCSVYDTYEWIRGLEDFINQLWRGRIPLVGICFGHQLIAATLGGKVELADHGWLLGMHEIEVERPKPWMRSEAAQHPLYFINQDQVIAPPPAFERLAGSDACPYAMLTVDDRILTVQAHPEQPQESMLAFSQVLLERYGLDRGVFDAAVASMTGMEPDSSRIATWICNFIDQAVDKRRLQ